MNRRKYLPHIGLPLLVIIATVLPLVSHAQADSARYPCRAVHTFDYWVGTFDAKPWDKPESPSGGTLRNTREYDGCVFVERWSSADANDGSGMSMVFFDTTRRSWRMVWNDDANGSTVFDEGAYKEGAMRFRGWKVDPSGHRVMAMNVLQNVSPGLIRHTFSTSSDSGRTWVVRSDGRFVRRAE